MRPTRVLPVELLARVRLVRGDPGAGDEVPAGAAEPVARIVGGVRRRAELARAQALGLAADDPRDVAGAARGVSGRLRPIRRRGGRGERSRGEKGRRERREEPQHASTLVAVADRAIPRDGGLSDGVGVFGERLQWRYADVAQLVEHFTRNEGVLGSSPSVGSRERPAERRPFLCSRRHAHALHALRWPLDGRRYAPNPAARSFEAAFARPSSASPA